MIGAVALAVVCWAFSFGAAWVNFWVKISLSVTLLCLYSFMHQKPKLRFTLNTVTVGGMAALVLYGIFCLGNAAAPYILPGAGGQVGEIYALGTGTNGAVLFLLLLLITGPGEEIFWRGFLQERMMHRFGDARGYAVTTALYGGVHLFSMNVILVTAAVLAGAFWGGLYLWKRDLAPVIVSHALRSAFAFVIFPIY